MMEFCVGTMPQVHNTELVKRAEGLGVSHFGVGEGPLLFSDPYQYLALAARETSTIRLGTYVTNPLTRIPAQTANNLATLNTLAPGRVFLGIGTANNALRSMGHRTAKVEEIGEAVRVITGLLRGERVTHSWLGQERELEFLDPDGGWYNVTDPVEVWVAAGGPRGLANAARTADAVVYCAGPDPTLLTVVRRELDRLVAAAGRPAGSVKLVALSWFYLMRPGDTLQDAVTNGFGSGAISSCLTDVEFLKAHREELGPDIVDASIAAAMAYLGPPETVGATHYLDVWRRYMRGLDERHLPLITEQLVDYWCLYGDRDQVVEKAQLMRKSGADMVSVFLSNPATVDRDLDDIGATILASR